jgi:hypothetical protein
MRLFVAMSCLFTLVACGDGDGASSESSTCSATACGITEDEFAAGYTDKYCAQLETCGSDFACSTSGTTATTTTALANCEFDAAAAQDCLDGEWTCDDSLNLPNPPAACGTVYTCTTGTTTTSGSTGT